MKQFIITILGVIVGGVILIMLPIIFLIIVGGVMTVFSGSSEKENCVLVYDLSTNVEDRGIEDPMAMLSAVTGENNSAVGLNQIINALDEAAEDDNIVGLMLTGSASGAGYANMKEILPHLKNFKESGKFVYYYNETMSQSALYLASLADGVYVMPEGAVEIYGVESTAEFYKGALDLLGVEMQIVRHGKFKSAIEPYVNDKMSPEAKEQTQRMIDVIWDDVKNTIAEHRGIDASVIDEYANKMDFVSTESAIEKNLIDSVMFRDEFLSALKKEIGIDEDDDIESIDIAKYNVTTSDAFGEVAVIYAQGEIVDGSNEGDATTIHGDDLARTIRKARRDDDIKAIVLRVNSPGGSVNASEIIWREVKIATETKPVVVSMGSMAASGGYYISCPADKIYADETTLTGSIGIFGVIPCLEKTAGKVGVTFDTTKTNEGGRLGAYKPMNEIQKQYVQGMIERGYATFIGHCAEGRGTTIEHIDSIGQGRVWTGLDAVEIGLVDEIGTLEDAIAYAAELAELDEDYGVRELPVIDDSFAGMMKRMGMDAKASIGKMMFGETYDLVEKVNALKKEPSVMARMECDFEIR